MTLQSHRWRPPTGEIALAAGFAALGVAITVGLVEGALLIPAVGLTVAHSAVLAWRRRYPELVLAAMGVTGLAYVLAGWPSVGLGPALLAGVHGLGVTRERRRAYPVLAATVAVMAAGVTLSDAQTPTVVGNAIALSIAWWIGDRQRRIQQRAVTAERDSEARARQAVAEERLRIARELHDVVAHAMSVIAVQAGTGRVVLDTRPRHRPGGARRHRGDEPRGAGRDAPPPRRCCGPTTIGAGPLAPSPGLARPRRAGRGHRPRRPAGRGAHRRRPRRRCPRASTSPPTASCRRRSPTCAGTPRATRAEVRGGVDSPAPSTSRCSTTAMAAATAPARAGRQRPGRDAGAGRALRRHPRGRRPARRAASGSPAHLPCGERRVIRVAVADDQPLVRAGFGALVDHADDLELVGRGRRRRGGRRAGRRGPARRPPDGRPHAAASTASRRPAASPPIPSCAGVRVVILTTFDLDEYVYGALRAGASGFLLKDVTPERPRRRHPGGGRRRRAARPERHPPADRALRRQPGRRRPAQTDPARCALLTDREREVLGLVARGLSNAEIGERIHVSHATAKTHVGRILDQARPPATGPSS